MRHCCRLSGSIAAVVFACLGCASAPPPQAPTHAKPAERQTFVQLRGPDAHDCRTEAQGARAEDEASATFFSEFTCRVHNAWKCQASCRGNELLISHVALRVQREGHLQDERVIQKSDRADYDDLNLGALRTGAPFPAPPVSLLDAAGTVALNVEFVCDCASRPANTAAR